MLEHMFIFGVILPTLVTIILFIAFLVCWFKFNMREKLFGKKQLHNPTDGVLNITTVTTSGTNSPDPCRQNTLNFRHDVMTSQTVEGDNSSVEDSEEALYDENTVRSNSNNEVQVFYNPNLVNHEMAGKRGKTNRKQVNQSRNSSQSNVDPDTGQSARSSFPSLYKDNHLQGNVYTDFVPITDLVTRHSNDDCHGNNKYNRRSFGHNMSHVNSDYNSSTTYVKQQSNSKLSNLVNVNDVNVSVA